ncbi:sterol desaturase family protein [Haliea sp. E17]|uniref:sterol desaturase family protein n=1 Tax=Haliea sp. E17 TaxID=3401576 RepID=UPI003AAE66B8
MTNPFTWITVVVLLMLLVEVFAGRHRGVHSRDELLVNGLCILLGVSVRPLLAAAVAMLIAVLLPAGRGALSGLPFWPALLAIVLLAEFVNYWVHRWAHNAERHPWLNWLWAFHRTHHTAPYMNVMLHFRVHFAWALVSGLTWVISLAIYLGQGVAAGVAVIIFGVYGVLTHSHFRWDDRLRAHPRYGRLFRAMEHVLVSPGIHHSHHGFGRDGGNYRNFGIFLSIYDWWFGTLHIPAGRPAHYGIPRRKLHWAEEVFYPLYRGRALAFAPGERRE